MKASLSDSEERMIMKIVVDGDSDRVLGVHILGDDAGEMAQLLAISLQARREKGRFRRHDGPASLGVGRTGHAAHAHGAPFPRLAGVLP